MKAINNINLPTKRINFHIKPTKTEGEYSLGCQKRAITERGASIEGLAENQLSTALTYFAALLFPLHRPIL